MEVDLSRREAKSVIAYSELDCFDGNDVVKAGIIAGCVKRDVLRVEYILRGQWGLRRLYIVLVVLEMKGDYWVAVG